MIYSLPHRSRLLTRFALGVMVGVVALWWAGRGLDWRLVFQTLAKVCRAWVAVSVIGVVAVALAKTARWQALYRASGRWSSFVTLFAGLMAAQAINLIVPVRLGELIRLGWMKQSGQPGAITLSTIVVEKVIDLLTAGLIATSLVALAAAPSWLRTWALSALLTGLAFVVGLVLIWRLRAWLERRLARGLGWGGWLPARWQGRLLHMAHTTLAALGVLADWRSLLTVFSWTIIAWLFSLLTIVSLFAAFELRLPAAAAVLIMLAVSFSNIAPSPPVLLGVMQLIAVLVLGGYGVARPVAVGFGTVLNVVTVAPLLLLGGWAVCSRIASVATWLRQHSSGELWAEQ